MKSKTIDRGAAATIAAAAILPAAFALTTGGAVGIARTGTVMAIVVILTAAVFGRVAWQGILPRPFAGSIPLILMTLLAGLGAISVGWSVLPGASNFDATRMITYTAILALGALGAQLLRTRSREFLIGLMLGLLIICLYSLASRIQPGWFSPSDDYARLRMPFEYWNAVGVAAALGLIGALWLGTTRRQTLWPVALSYAAGGVFLLTLMLSQSRGALAVALLGVAIWLVVVPRRLRSSLWLAAVVAIGGLATAWAYAQPAFSQDAVAFAERQDTGHILLLVMALMSVALAALGYAVERKRRTDPLDDARRQALGKALLIALAIAPFVLIGAVSIGGNDGVKTIPNSVGNLFDTGKLAPSNSPNRLTQTNSLRARYWNDAFKIWRDNRLHGTGGDSYSVARLPYRHDQLNVVHAHGFVPQILSDFGIYGLLLMLALAIAWFVAMLRVFGAGGRRKITKWLDGSDDEALAIAAIALIAFTFGAHSAIDWTWFVPGVAGIGLLAAGWTFGWAGMLREAGATSAAGSVAVVRSVPRPINAPATPTTGAGWRTGDWQQRLLRTAGIALVGIAGAYAIYQPARSAKSVDQGYSELAQGQAANALRDGRRANDFDPTSDKPFYLNAAAHDMLNRQRTADAVLARAATLQPANPDTWVHLASYRLHSRGDALGAIEALRPLLFLSPNSVRGHALLVEAKQRLTTDLLRTQIESERRRLKRELRKIRRNAEKRGDVMPPPAAPLGR